MKVLEGRNLISILLLGVALTFALGAGAGTVGLNCYYNGHLGQSVWIDYGAKAVTVGNGSTQQTPGTYPANITATTIKYSDGKTVNVIDRTTGIMTQQCLGGCSSAPDLQCQKSNAPMPSVQF